MIFDWGLVTKELQRMTVRLKDIANDLNLSKMTISKVLRGQTDVSAATKARVLQRVKELNYRPNIPARSLRTGNTLTIGLVIPSLTNFFFADVARGLVQTVRAAGYGVLISSAEEDPEIERHEIELQLSRQVDALIVASVQESAEFFVALGRQRAPVILVDRKVPSFAARFVGLRDQDIGYVAAAHLADVGCRRVAYLRGPRTASADLRWSGYRAALTEFDLSFKPDFVVDCGDSSRNEYHRGYEAMQRLLASKVKPDGVMCYSDILALGVIDAVLAKGMRVPDDICVVGCGDQPSLREMRIPLTSVNLSGVEVGQKTAHLALRALSNSEVSRSRNFLLSPKLVVRRSSQR
jgi:LacI family transcriptional regulator